jgi:4-hydroxymandelate oxidase
MEPLNLEQYQQAAAGRLPPEAFGYYRSGADSELTLAENEAAWRRLSILPSILVDVSARSTATTVLGEPWEFPVAVAPMALQGMAHPEGELATARAAGASGTVMILSTMSNRPVEEVVAASAGPVWFQLYVSRDRSETDDLVARVEDAGCSALVVTADVPVLGRREADVHLGFRLPDELELPNIAGRGQALHESPPRGHSALADFADRTLDPALSFRDIERFAARTRLPVLLKGVMRAGDALRAFEHGARGIIVSNHGGRQLDTVPATARVLPDIVDAVADRGEVLVDGGIRRGTDVFKALALGARAVLLGRPALWGLAVEGEAGVRRVLGLLRDELDRAMALAGCPNVAAIGRNFLAPPGA